MNQFVKKVEAIEYPDDVRYLVQVCADHGYWVTEALAEAVWAAYSEDVWAASWMPPNEWRLGEQSILNVFMERCAIKDMDEENDE